MCFLSHSSAFAAWESVTLLCLPRCTTLSRYCLCFSLPRPAHVPASAWSVDTAGHVERCTVRRDVCALKVASGAVGALPDTHGAAPPCGGCSALRSPPCASKPALGVCVQELSRRGLAKADIESGLHSVFGSDLNSVQLCPPGAEECELDEMAHEPERASPACVVVVWCWAGSLLRCPMCWLCRS